MTVLRFLEFEGVLRQHFSVTLDYQSAFAARLKQIKRLGVPQGSTSQQRQALSEYSMDGTLQAAVTIDLMSAGMPASRAVAVATRYWKGIQAGFGRTLAATARAQDRATYILILSQSVQSSRDDGGHKGFLLSREGLISAIKDDQSQSNSTYVILRLDTLFRSLSIILRKRFNRPVAGFQSDVEEWRMAWDQVQNTWGQSTIEGVEI